jgi:hypothetical protein
MSVDDYVAARNSLIGQDLIAFDGTLFQVLALPNSAEANKSHQILSENLWR